MAATSTDIKFYLSANRPEADTGTSGGARDATMQLLLPANADVGGAGVQVDCVSTSASDTGNIVIAGYGAGGAWLTETLALNGLSHVHSANPYLYVCKLQMAAAAVGIVTCAQYGALSNVIHAIPATEKGAARLFLKAFANAAGGASLARYEKLFVGNANATGGMNTMTDALTVNSAGELAGALEKAATVQATGGTESVAARTTAPTGGGSYSWVDMVTPLAMGDGADGNLVAGEYQGVWLRLTLAAGRAPTQATAATMQGAGIAS
jgi:hypothetical protein